MFKSSHSPACGIVTRCVTHSLGQDASAFGVRGKGTSPPWIVPLPRATDLAAALSALTRLSVTTAT